MSLLRRNKEQKGKNTNQSIKRVLGKVRRPFGPPHLTLKASPLEKKTKKSKNKNNKKKRDFLRL